MQRTLFSRMSPGVTDMVRMDHTHLVSAFHQYRADTPVRVKQGLADTIGLSLEVNAQLKQEVLYPALREVAPELFTETLETQRRRVRELIGRLQALKPEDASFDTTFYELMNAVLHQIADEESLLLPKAEALLDTQLRDMGAQMTRRRMQLVGPRGVELAGGAAKAVSTGTVLAAAGALAAAGGILLATRASPRWH